MRINGITTALTLPADKASEAVAPEAQSVANPVSHAASGGSPFAALGEPAARALLNVKPESAPLASAHGPGGSTARQVAEQHGIIVIGGSQSHDAAATVRDAARQGPMLQGIIIVGGSPISHLVPKVR